MDRPLRNVKPPQGYMTSETLIEAVRNRPPLWDDSLPGYRDRQLRNVLWGEISKLSVGGSPKDCQKEWDKLRRGLSNSRNRFQKKHGASGSAGCTYKPYKYEHLMKFIESFNGKDDMDGNLDDVDDDEDDIGNADEIQTEDDIGNADDTQSEDDIITEEADNSMRFDDILIFKDNISIKEESGIKRLPSSSKKPLQDISNQTFINQAGKRKKALFISPSFKKCDSVVSPPKKQITIVSSNSPSKLSRKMKKQHATEERRKDVVELLAKQIEAESAMQNKSTASGYGNNALGAFEQAILCELQKKEDEVSLFLASLYDPVKKLPPSIFRKFQMQVIQMVASLEENKFEGEVPFFQPTSEMLKEVDAALRTHPDKQCVVVNDFLLRGRDLHTLLEGKWLNDQIMNSYFSLIAARGNGKHMDSFYFHKLESEGCSQKTWDSTLMQYSYMVVPVFRPNHWATIYVCLKSKTISYMDSMGGLFVEGQSTLKRFLQNQTGTNEWEIQTRENKNQPKQTNSNDCGVFACMFANLKAAGKPLQFSQADIHHIRKRILFEICHGKLLPLP